MSVSLAPSSIHLVFPGFSARFRGASWHSSRTAGRSAASTLRRRQSRGAKEGCIGAATLNSERRLDGRQPDAAFAQASTLLDHQGGIQMRLSGSLRTLQRHVIRAAYNYAKHLPERRKMMQAWADYLAGLRGAGT